ncbi:MAG: hypothetical protein ABJC13_23180 [Acidobacteriota bacterium]
MGTIAQDPAAADKSVLRIEFTGAIAFVPDKPLFVPYGDHWKEGSPTQMAILMPNLLRPDFASWGKGICVPPAFRATHIPHLTFRYEDFDSVYNREVEHWFFRSSTQMGMLLLKHEHVKVPYGASEKLVCKNKVYPKNMKIPQTADEKSSLWWIPHAERLSKESRHHDVQPVFDPRTDYNLKEKPVVSTVYFERGTLSLGGLHETLFNGKDLKIDSWQFGLSNWSRLRRQLVFSERVWGLAVGNKTVLEVPFEGDTITIGIALRGENETDGSITFKNEKNKVITVEIGNEEPETALGLNEGPFSNDLPDPDFEGFYYLSHGKRSGPVPLVNEGTGGDSLRPCSPKVMRGFR